MQNPDKKLAAVCGLFCPSCTIYIGTQEDPERLKFIADRMGYPIEQLACNGCRSDKRCGYCDTCKMSKCASEKGLEFCSECSDYPCEDLKAFQTMMPHRNELWDSQAQIKELGFDAWWAKQVERYSCPECKTLNSAYDITCRKCGATPGSPYVAENKEAILAHLAKLKG